MATPSVSTWNLTPPRRPGINDVGGGAKTQSAAYPPDPATKPTADDVNQWQFQLVAIAGMIPCATITVANSGSPAMTDVASPIDAVAGHTTSGDVLTVTDNGVGDTSITWAANTFPPPIGKPKAYVTGATTAEIAVDAITNGVRIRTKDNTGAAVDVPFVVDVM